MFSHGEVDPQVVADLFDTSSPSTSSRTGVGRWVFCRGHRGSRRLILRDLTASNILSALPPPPCLAQERSFIRTDSWPIAPSGWTVRCRRPPSCRGVVRQAFVGLRQGFAIPAAWREARTAARTAAMARQKRERERRGERRVCGSFGRAFDQEAGACACRAALTSTGAGSNRRRRRGKGILKRGRHRAMRAFCEHMGVLSPQSPW